MGREEREQVRVNRVKERREKKGGERQGERVGVGEAGVVREGGGWRVKGEGWRGWRDNERAKGAPHRKQAIKGIPASQLTQGAYQIPTMLI